MFESVDAAGALAAVEANEAALVEHETRRLALAATWADLHPGDAVDPAGLPGRERAIRPGGDGTPEIADFCLADLATALRASSGTAARLIADALDLRHRLPRTWAKAQAGQVPAYQARRVAFQTRKLTRAQAGEIDARVAPKLGAVPYGRLLTLLEAFVYDADPEGADAEAEQQARDRFVRLGRTSEHGFRVLVGKIAAGDAAWGFALTTRLAEVLRRDGDPDTLDVRRSKAFGLLITQPAEALALLNAHRDDDPDPQDEEPPDEESREPEPAEQPEVAAEGSRSEPVEEPARVVRIVPPPFDPSKARPRAVVYIHLSKAALTAGRGVARVEDIGPVLMTRLRGLLGDRCQILLKPVIDLNDTPTPVDAYEIPDAIAEHVRLRQPVDVFPFAGGGTRRTDLDHSTPFLAMDQGGPPGQTRIDNLGPLARYSHRVRTHGRWRLRRPDPDSWLWRSPHGRLFLVNSTGTHPLGRSAWTKQLWRAAKAPPDEPVDEVRTAAVDRRSRAETIIRGFLDAHALAS
jgi:Domain of unknown function (DUF222)